MAGYCFKRAGGADESIYMHSIKGFSGLTAEPLLCVVSGCYHQHGLFNRCFLSVRKPAYD